MAPLNYSEVLCSYPVCMTALCGFCVTLMFNFLGPINVDKLFYFLGKLFSRLI